MPITKLMTGLPNQSMSQTDFDAASAKFMGELPAWGVEATALEANVNAKEELVSAAAATVISNTDVAVDAAAVASDAATAAQAAAETSANAAAGFLAASATTNTVGTGLKTYDVGADKSFFRGMFVVAVSASDIAVYITGQVDSYSGTNLAIDGKAVGTPGAVANDWIIGPSGSQGARGPVGSLDGTNLSGALNAARAADLASAATIDPWSGAGNFMVLTGNEIISSFGTAPQAGAARSLLVAGHPVLVSSANLRIKGVRIGRAIALAPSDELDVIAATTTEIRLTVTRADGSSPSDRARMHSALLSF